MNNPLAPAPSLAGLNTLGPIMAFVTILLTTSIQPAYAKQAHNAKPMELSGFSLSEAYDIKDDQPLSVDALMIEKLLYRIKRTSPKSRHAYSRYSQSLSWDDIVNKTEDHRLWVFDRRARLKKTTKQKFANVIKGAEIKGAFICHCVTTDGDPFLVLSRTMPNALQSDGARDELVQVTGFLYGRASGWAGSSQNDNADQTNVPVFIADRLSWFPEKTSDTVSDSLVRLANAGVDIGLLDTVRESNTQPLKGKDAEAFFQMLSGVKEMKSGIGVQPRLGFADLMQKANSHFGQAVRIKGVVRRCTPIPQSESDIQDRLGISNYYELIIFPDLDGAKIIVKNKDGGQLDYQRFPVTVCCTELPEGMSPSDIERKPFVVDGFFFRFWKYQSDKTDLAGTSGQVSPLIITNSPFEVKSQRGILNSVMLILTIGFIAVLVAVIYGFRVADRTQKSPSEKMLETLPKRIDLSGIDD